MKDRKPDHTANPPDSSDDETPTLLDGHPNVVMYLRSGGLDGDTLVDGHQGGSKPVVGSSQKQALQTLIQQLHYNENKVALDRAINVTVALVEELAEENQARPVFFPVATAENPLLNLARAHVALVKGSAKEKQLQKAKLEEEAPEFKVLALLLKTGHGSHADVAGALDKETIAALFDQKLKGQIKYLLNLKDRVDDTSSKVFITGDLNAGKLTFCNALLRRKVLPEDQQPCTLVFCEVIDANRENDGVEEVHAVPIGATYLRQDELTFSKHQLAELEELVQACDRFQLLKVYVVDQRRMHQLLLHNGVIDLKLIDAPGLNMDLYQTTQVFSRQEEIDLVVFVVLAENHFTLLAKEFIAAAAAEKRYVFIVVNRFDNIKDKEKCKRRILDQVELLSPATHKNALEFVHFVSSDEVGDGPDGPDGGDGPGDDDGPDHPDFDQLEALLRKFILDKRALSKLLPAKDYLTNLLGDLDILCKLNQRIWSQEALEKTKELTHKVAPLVDDAVKAGDTLAQAITATIERVCLDTYDNTRNFIVDTVNKLGTGPLVAYPGVLGLYEYAVATQRAMINAVLALVTELEQFAREVTIDTVDEVINEGKKALGDEFLQGKLFNLELMFLRKRDISIRNLDTLIEVADFFDPSLEGFLVFVGIPKDLVSHTATQLDAYTPAQILTGLSQTADNLKNASGRSLAVHTLYSSSKILGAGAVVSKLVQASSMMLARTVKYVAVPLAIGAVAVTLWYLVSDIPAAYPRNVARKLKRQIHSMEYPHANATRTAKEVREVLNYPARQVHANFQTSLDKRKAQKEKLEKEIADANTSYAYFSGLHHKIAAEKTQLQGIELERVNTVD